MGYKFDHKRVQWCGETLNLYLQFLGRTRNLEGTIDSSQEIQKNLREIYGDMNVFLGMTTVIIWLTWFA